MTTAATYHYSVADREARDALMIDACVGLPAALDCIAAAPQGDPDVTCIRVARQLYRAVDDTPDDDGLVHADAAAEVAGALCLSPDHTLLALLDGLLAQAPRDASLLADWRRTVVRPLRLRVDVCPRCMTAVISRHPSGAHSACEVETP